MCTRLMKDAASVSEINQSIMQRRVLQRIAYVVSTCICHVQPTAHKAVSSARNDMGDFAIQHNMDMIRRWQMEAERKKKRLIISSQQLLYIPFDLSIFQHLVVLDCSDNMLRGFPDSICKLTALETLLCQRNVLRSLPSSIGMLTRLKYFNCSFNLLSWLPMEIGNLQSLEVLHGVHNDITALPASLLGASLKKLYIGCNFLCEFPCVNGPVLLTLDMQMCNLNLFPDSVCKLNTLTTLIISNSFVPSLPDNIGDLILLKELNISCNDISILPTSMQHMHDLMTLNMSFNQIACLPAELCCGWTSLCKFHAQCNLISCLPASIGQLTNLTTLNISHNRISQFPPSINRLTKLHLAYIVPGNNFSVSLPTVFNLTTGSYWPRCLTPLPLYWHTRYHHRFPKSFQEMVLAFVACNRLGTKPYLPPEMIWEILHHIEYTSS